MENALTILENFSELFGTHTFVRQLVQSAARFLRRQELVVDPLAEADVAAVFGLQWAWGPALEEVNLGSKAAHIVLNLLQHFVVSMWVEVNILI